MKSDADHAAKIQFVLTDPYYNSYDHIKDHITEEVLHNRHWTKMLLFKMPLHSSTKLSDFPETYVNKFYIYGNLYNIFINCATLKADWL